MRTIFFDIKEYFEILMFEIWRIDCVARMGFES